MSKKTDSGKTDKLKSKASSALSEDQGEFIDGCYYAPRDN